MNVRRFLKLGWVIDAADTNDDTLARHEAWHRLHGADGAGVSEADVGALKIFDCKFVGTNLANDLVVRKQEAREVERVGVAQHWDNKCALAFALSTSTAKPMLTWECFCNIGLPSGSTE